VVVMKSPALVGLAFLLCDRSGRPVSRALQHRSSMGLPPVKLERFVVFQRASADAR
jgi:hypothetical protein